jgi:hypothetical protein
MYFYRGTGTAFYVNPGTSECFVRPSDWNRPLVYVQKSTKRQETKSPKKKRAVVHAATGIFSPLLHPALVVYTLRFLVAAARFLARGFGRFLVSSNSPLNSRGM